jgi:hypothetical protein
MRRVRQVLELEGGPDLALRVVLSEPVAVETVARAADLLAESRNEAVGPFPKESYQWHRLVPGAASSLSDRCTLRVPTTRSSIYLRVKQRNGHLAWISPVFVNYR